MATRENTVVQEDARFARYWWVFILLGLAWFLVAWLVLRMNVTSVATVGILIGVVFLFAAINDLGVASAASGGWKVWYYVMAGIFFLGALYGFFRPISTFFALASILGLILIFYGTFQLILAFTTRGVNPYWWINLISGILLVLLAFWVSGSDRLFALAQRGYLILFWVGFLALFRGIEQIVLAFAVRRAGRALATPDAATP
jgi:uncharacterized membrane protein HdeD (DUF308 family)